MRQLSFRKDISHECITLAGYSLVCCRARLRTVVSASEMTTHYTARSEEVHPFGMRASRQTIVLIMGLIAHFRSNVPPSLSGIISTMVLTGNDGKSLHIFTWNGEYVTVG